MRVRSLDRDAVLADLRALAAGHGAERPEIEEIRLFGSLARGTANPYADADLLIVVDATDLPFVDRVPRYKPIGSPVPMDVTVCTRAELSRELAAGNRFVRRIVGESIVLYTRGTSHTRDRRGERDG
ncbi:MAG: nucleotidyltransferase domain-containing protein [Chromatiales bacterium]